MQYAILGIVALGALIGLGRLFVALDPRTLASIGRYALAVVLLVTGVVLGLRGGFVAAGILVSAAVGMLFGGGRPGTRPLPDASGQAAKVRSADFEMELDLDSGAITGTVLRGAYAGLKLDDLDEQNLREVHAAVAGDEDSLALIEAYLDRRFPAWREHGEENVHARAGGAADAGAMTDEEAYQILGLSPGAGDADIRAAHRRLMKGVHPDQGGSTFLAAKLNQAKDRLLGKHS